MGEIWVSDHVFKNKEFYKRIFRHRIEKVIKKMAVYNIKKIFVSFLAVLKSCLSWQYGRELIYKAIHNLSVEAFIIEWMLSCFHVVVFN